jgi:hypothetical protein
VVHHGADTILALGRHPIQGSRSQAGKGLFGFATGVLKQPQLTPNGMSVARQGLNAKQWYGGLCWQGRYS